MFYLKGIIDALVKDKIDSEMRAQIKRAVKERFEETVKDTINSLNNGTPLPEVNA